MGVSVEKRVIKDLSLVVVGLLSEEMLESVFKILPQLKDFFYFLAGAGNYSREMAS